MITENGWPSCGPKQLDFSNVPGTTESIPLQQGQPTRILKAFAADLHAYVESIYLAPGGQDEGGWTPTNSVPTSNHLGGTAFDYNWNRHPMGREYDGWNSDQIATIRDMLKWYEGTVFWGNDWGSPKDSMHFQMGYDTYGNPHTADFITRKIRSDGFSTYRRDDAAWTALYNEVFGIA
jgi:hypothetical protein